MSLPAKKGVTSLDLTAQYAASPVCPDDLPVSGHPLAQVTRHGDTGESGHD